MHTWPGNVRELLNVIQRVVIKYRTSMLSADTCPRILHTAARRRTV